MSLSGPEALKSLDDALRDIRREEDEIAKRLARSAELVTKFRESESELLRQLASIRLDPATQKELGDRLSPDEPNTSRELGAMFAELDPSLQEEIGLQIVRREALIMTLANVVTAFLIWRAIETTAGMF